jgi:hypothetical protein
MVIIYKDDLKMICKCFPMFAHTNLEEKLFVYAGVDYGVL